jgi:hypothetical protein
MRMIRGVKRRLAGCALLLAAAITAGIARNIAVRAALAGTAAARMERGAEYFSGSVDMGAVEVLRASSGALLSVVDTVLSVIAGALVFVFLCNGLMAGIEYLRWKEKNSDDETV